MRWKSSQSAQELCKRSEWDKEQESLQEGTGQAAVLMVFLFIVVLESAGFFG